MIELSPTPEHLKDPYVLQLIEGLSMQQDQIEELEESITSRIGAEHFGPYGAVCINTGQFDSGECWLCYAKRKQEQSVLSSKKAGEMQLLAGRYQYLYAQARKALTDIDELFESNYKDRGVEALHKIVRDLMATFVEAVAKVKK